MARTSSRRHLQRKGVAEAMAEGGAEAPLEGDKCGFGLFHAGSRRGQALFIRQRRVGERVRGSAGCGGWETGLVDGAGEGGPAQTKPELSGGAFDADYRWRSEE